jgi:hypothetical protein
LHKCPLRYTSLMSLLNKDTWRKAWLNSIYELTTYNLQERTWLDRNNTNPHYTFGEFLCSYFDDLLNDIPYEEYIKMCWVSDKEYQILKEWHSRLDEYQSPGNNDFDPIAVLNDPLWKDIVKQGESTRLKLLEVLADDEKEILAGKRAETHNFRLFRNGS